MLSYTHMVLYEEVIFICSTQLNIYKSVWPQLYLISPQNTIVLYS